MITQERVKYLFHYDPDTGVLRWERKPHIRFNDSLIGRRAGTLRRDGYRQVRVDGKIYNEHTIIFLWAFGRIPKQIDHANRNQADNRLANIRECTQSQNNGNKVVQSNNKTTGVKGIWFTGKSYQVQIKCGDICICKNFADLEKAKNFRRIQSVKLFGEFHRS
jgi:HNH endonuclease